MRLGVRWKMVGGWVGGWVGGGATDDKIIALALPDVNNKNQLKWGVGSNDIALAMATPLPPMMTTLRGKCFGGDENQQRQ